MNVCRGEKKNSLIRYRFIVCLCKTELRKNTGVISSFHFYSVVHRSREHWIECGHHDLVDEYVRENLFLIDQIQVYCLSLQNQVSKNYRSYFHPLFLLGGAYGQGSTGLSAVTMICGGRQAYARKLFLINYFFFSSLFVFAKPSSKTHYRNHSQFSLLSGGNLKEHWIECGHHDLVDEHVRQQYQGCSSNSYQS